MALFQLKSQRIGQRGAAAIEFALVFPLFLLVLFAVVVWSTFFFVQGAVDYAARESVRASLAVDPEAYETAEAYQSAVEQSVSNAAGSALDVLPESWSEDVVGGLEGGAMVSIEAAQDTNGQFVVVGLRYPQGTPVSGLTDLGIFQGIGLIPERGAYAEARMPLRGTE
ncbi:MAG: TadE/TadG family type IV pilus assembly protein [Pseudomonadota bacterium]